MARLARLESLFRKNVEENQRDGTSAAGAVTITAGLIGTITTESLTTAALTDYTLTITNPAITASDRVFCTLNYSGAGDPIIAQVIPTAGQVVVVVRNAHATNALNASAKIAYLVM